MLRIGILASHGGTNLQAVIDNIESGYLKAEIVSVLSNNKNAYALERARNHGISAIHISKKGLSVEEYDKLLINHFNEVNVDLIIVAGFMIIIGEQFIKAYENKIINIHPALIPSFCGQGFYGLKVHEAVIEKGVKITGATVHFVNEEPDGGPIILQRAIEVLDTDTAESLQKRVLEEIEWKLLSEAVKLICENKLTIKDNIVRRI